MDANALLCGRRPPDDVALAVIADVLTSVDAALANVGRIHQEHLLGDVRGRSHRRTRGTHALTVGLALDLVLRIARRSDVSDRQFRVDDRFSTDHAGTARLMRRRLAPLKVAPWNTSLRPSCEGNTTRLRPPLCTELG